MILDIHLEYVDDKGERLRKLLALNKPIIISIPPVLLMPNHKSFKNETYPSDYFYPEEIVDILKENRDNSNLIIGQQGFLHYCESCLKRKAERDPWHENFCLYESEKSIEEQKQIVDEGKRIIKERLEIPPKLYTPPNHLYDKNTLIAAASAGFRYFADRAKIDIKPYKTEKLIILPEGKLGQKVDVIYAHYDRMDENERDFDKYIDVINNSESLDSISSDEMPCGSLLQNERLKLKAKLERDVKAQEKSDL